MIYGGGETKKSYLMVSDMSRYDGIDKELRREHTKPDRSPIRNMRARGRRLNRDGREKKKSARVGCWRRETLASRWI